MKEIVIICLLHTGAAGDNENVLGTAKALQNKLHINGTNVIRLDVEPQTRESQISAVVQGHKANDFIILGSGQKGYHSLIAIKQLNLGKKIYANWCGHQFFDFLTEPTTSLLNSVALPASSLKPWMKHNFKTLRVKLKETEGVPHNTYGHDLEFEYLEAKNKITSANSYLLVILPGDAELPEVKDKTEKERFKYFKVKEAENLAEYIAQIAKESKQFVIVTNGHRTGRRDPNTGREVNKHYAIDPIDPVSQAFCNRLETRLSAKKQGFQFFDFKIHDGGRIESNYKALLYLVKITDNSVVYIPGESTSRISEVVDNLPADKIVIFENGAMNGNHKENIEKVYRSHIPVLQYRDEQYLLDVRRNNILQRFMSTRDADRVANSIITNFFQNEFMMGTLAAALVSAYFTPLHTLSASLGIFAANTFQAPVVLVGTAALGLYLSSGVFIASALITYAAKTNVDFIECCFSTINNRLFQNTVSLEPQNNLAG